MRNAWNFTRFLENRTDFARIAPIFPFQLRGEPWFELRVEVLRQFKILLFCHQTEDLHQIRRIVCGKLDRLGEINSKGRGWSQ